MSLILWRRKKDTILVSFFENDQNVCCYGSIDLMLDKLFVNRIHLQNIYMYIYGYKSLIKVTRHRLTKIHFTYAFEMLLLLLLLRAYCASDVKTPKKKKKRDKVNFQSLLDFASCLLNYFKPFAFIRTFKLYAWSSIKLPITNGFYVSTPKKNWNAIAKPLHLRKKATTT